MTKHSLAESNSALSRSSASKPLLIPQPLVTWTVNSEHLNVVPRDTLHSPLSTLTSLSYLDVSLAGGRICLVGDGEADSAEADVLHLVAGDELLLQLHVARDLFSEVGLVTGDRPAGGS